MTTAVPNRPKLTLENCKALSRDPEFIRCAALVLAAQTVAETTRARVDRYIDVVFRHFDFRVGLKCDRPIGARITTPKELYLCTDEPLLKEYYARCDDARKMAGYCLPEGHCPALVANNLLTDAEHVLLQKADAFLGTPLSEAWRTLEQRSQAVRLMLGMALQNPATERQSRSLLPKNQSEVNAFLREHSS